MIRDNREYRDMPMMARAEAEGYTVEGYASTFEEYELWNDGFTSFCERIEPTAFEDCDMSDVVFLIDHAGRVYARTRNNTLQLEVDGKGLKTRTDLSKTNAARGVYEDIECGNYDRMSFAFTVDQDVIERQSESKVTRVIKHIAKLYDVSAVSFPANPTTDIGVSRRSLFDGFIEKEKQDLAEQEKRHQLELAKAKFEFATARKEESDED